MEEKIQQGWQCPKCKRIFSPYVLACTYCNEEITNNTGLKEHCVNYNHLENEL